MEAVILISLIAFSGAVVLWFVTGVDIDFSRELCRVSVTSAASTKILQSDSPFQLQCNTRTVQIKEGTKKVERKKNIVKSQISNSKELERVIAEEIAGCWWQMGKGELNPFGAYANWGKNTRCVICSEVTFDKKILKDYESIDVFEYMKDNKYEPSDIREIKSVKYSDILPQENLASKPLLTSKQGIPQNYQVVFALGQTNPLLSWLNVVTLGISGYLKITGSLNQEFTAATIIAPSGSFEGQCDKLY